LLLFKPQKGEWEIPSGFINKDEKPIKAALRELKEETKIVLQEKQLILLKLD
jgi:ADP-ribose pyrophosphatase YjhB (NUDIX family)